MIGDSLHTAIRRVRNVTRPDALWELAQRAVRSRSKSADLVILDDVYPNPFGAWRATEFHAYLDAFYGAEIHVDDRNLAAAGWTRSRLQAFRWLRRAHPRYAKRVRPFVDLGRPRATGIYCLFLNGINNFLPYVERQGLPFVFTLYPGGGFQLNERRCDAALRRVFASPHFRGVIATQHVTANYLSGTGLVPPSRVRLIWGGVMPPGELDQRPARRVADKSTLDIGFVAHKYMPGGIDKGYDTFVSTSNLIATAIPNAVFHVIGPFGAADAPGGRHYHRFRFHGTVPSARLPELFSELDLVVSPNVPFRLAPGAFDGFPTGGCVQAGLAGVGVFCSDELRENRAFVDGRDLVIIPPKAEEIADRVIAYARDRERLRVLGECGREAFRRVYGYEAQLAPRIAALSEWLGLSAAPHEGFGDTERRTRARQEATP